MQEVQSSSQEQNKINQAIQYQEQEEKDVQIEENGRGRICKHCGAVLSMEDRFCPECGEEYDKPEKECRFCGTMTTADFCPVCGKRVVPVICPSCNMESYSPNFCENCGTALIQEARDLVEKPVEQQTIKRMSQEEAEAIKKQAESYTYPELEKFEKELEKKQKQKEERAILRKEKEYFQNRETRIRKVFGLHPYEIEVPDFEDEKFRQEAYKGLKEIVLHREKEELEQKMLEWKKQQDEIESKRLAEARERIKKEFEAGLEQKSESIEQALQQEAQRLEEERKRREEEERRRLEELNRKTGCYQYNCSAVREHRSRITINGNSFTGYDLYSGDSFSGVCTISGTRITLTTTSVSGQYRWAEFTGSFAGRQFTGNWSGSSCYCEHTYVKI